MSDSSRYRVYGDMLSGNCYKIKLLMQFLNIPHDWVHVDILAGETRTATFLAKNANGKIPVLEIEGTHYLCESNAILNFLAEGTAFMPSDPFARAQVLQWQFFEQYSHEPYIAVARYINKYLGLPENRKEEYFAKHKGGYRALDVIEQHLAKQLFLVGETTSIADISLYAYTHVAHEGGFSLEAYPNIQRWLKSIEQVPNYCSMA